MTKGPIEDSDGSSGPREGVDVDWKRRAGFRREAMG